jgi:hypothetical protein
LSIDSRPTATGRAPDADDVSARIIRRVRKELADEATGKPRKAC